MSDLTDEAAQPRCPPTTSCTSTRPCHGDEDTRMANESEDRIKNESEDSIEMEAVMTNEATAKAQKSPTRRKQRRRRRISSSRQYYVRHDYHDHSQEDDGGDEHDPGQAAQSRASLRQQGELHIAAPPSDHLRRPRGDASRDGRRSDADAARPKRRRRRAGSSAACPFPVKLHDVLSAAEKNGDDDVVCWMPHGRAFIVRDQEKLVNDVLPKYFKQTKLTSFQRQLNLYGFIRLTRDGPDRRAYYHELFLRGMPHLSRRMLRMKIKGTGRKGVSNPAEEPDFYAMPPVGTEAMKDDGQSCIACFKKDSTNIMKGRNQEEKYDKNELEKSIEEVGDDDCSKATEEGYRQMDETGQTQRSSFTTKVADSAGDRYDEPRFKSNPGISSPILSPPLPPKQSPPLLPTKVSSAAAIASEPCDTGQSGGTVISVFPAIHNDCVGTLTKTSESDEKVWGEGQDMPASQLQARNQSLSNEDAGTQAAPSNTAVTSSNKCFEQRMLEGNAQAARQFVPPPPDHLRWDGPRGSNCDHASAAVGMPFYSPDRSQQTESFGPEIFAGRHSGFRTAEDERAEGKMWYSASEFISRRSWLAPDDPAPSDSPFEIGDFPWLSDTKEGDDDFAALCARAPKAFDDEFHDIHRPLDKMSMEASKMAGEPSSLAQPPSDVCSVSPPCRLSPCIDRDMTDLSQAHFVTQSSPQGSRNKAQCHLRGEAFGQSHKALPSVQPELTSVAAETTHPNGNGAEMPHPGCDVWRNVPPTGDNVRKSEKERNWATAEDSHGSKGQQAMPLFAEPMKISQRKKEGKALSVDAHHPMSSAVTARKAVAAAHSHFSLHQPTKKWIATPASPPPPMTQARSPRDSYIVEHRWDGDGYFNRGAFEHARGPILLRREWEVGRLSPQGQDNSSGSNGFPRGGGTAAPIYPPFLSSPLISAHQVISSSKGEGESAACSLKVGGVVDRTVIDFEGSGIVPEHDDICRYRRPFHRRMGLGCNHAAKWKPEQQTSPPPPVPAHSSHDGAQGPWPQLATCSHDQCSVSVNALASRRVVMRNCRPGSDDKGDVNSNGVDDVDDEDDFLTAFHRAPSESAFAREFFESIGLIFDGAEEDEMLDPENDQRLGAVLEKVVRRIDGGLFIG